MKLQHKAWALVLVTVGLLTLMAGWVAGHTISATFSTMETAWAEVEGERARRLLGQQMDSLAATLKDYAYWNETVGFVKGARTEYLDENFTVESMKTLRVSEILILDLKGRSLSGVAVNGSGTMAPIGESHTGILQTLAAPVLADSQGDTVVTTYLVADGQLYLVAIAAVRTDARSGTPPVGAMAMLRRFDQRELVNFSQVLMLPVALSLDDPGHDGERFHMLFVDDGHALAHAAIVDHGGVPVAELVLALNRSLHLQGQSQARSATYAVALTGLLIGAFLVLLLDRLLLRRLQGIHDDLRHITDHGLMSDQRVRVMGEDELGQLATGLNGLLERVRKDAAEQRLSFAAQEKLQLQLMQSQKTEALGRLTSGIAHDFNNSLAAIGGWMRLADEDLSNDHPSHESLQHALKATRYAGGIMRQLLTFSRQATPHVAPLEIAYLIRESRNLVSSGLLRTCRLEVEYPSTPTWVLADMTQMQQVLVNLLMNASDAMGGVGLIKLTATVTSMPLPAGEQAPEGIVELSEGAYVRIVVQDEGPGIASEHIGRIFDPFFTTKTVGKGSGLGLSVAHGIMSRHAGTIGVSTQMGVGSAFSVYLPQCEAPQSAPEQEPSVDQPSARHLLFVDDDQSVRHAWGAWLARQGWEVTRARDGDEAWFLYKNSKHPWDVVLTDLAMPKMDGVSLAKKIRATETPPPIVLMSGNVSADDAALLVTTDFVAVLQKPVEADELNRVLQQAMGDRRPRG